MSSKKNRQPCPVGAGTASVRKRKFSQRLASKIMTGKVKGRILTRDGRSVRILAWDARSDYPIVGLIYMTGLGKEISWQWTECGIAYGNIEGIGFADFTLVIELRTNNQSTVPRHRRGPNNKKRK